MIVIGVTGSLASGKTEVVSIFKKYGAEVFDADQAAKKVVQKGSPIYKAILKIFGQKYLLKNKELDRKKLAQYVFSHPKDLEKLNILVHPGVIFECVKTINRFRDKKGILVLDVPLLYESKMENLADKTVVVGASRKVMLARAKKRPMGADLAKKILLRQWPLKRKIRLADFVIQNNGSKKDLEKQVQLILEKIK